MKLTPLADRVVLKMTEAEETTKGGIILTGSGGCGVYHRQAGRHSGHRRVRLLRCHCKTGPQAGRGDPFSPA